MTREEKAAVLRAVAEAFADRGPDLQYDQLSMDRLVRVTPRHNWYLPPEAAAPQHRTYLDCSTFVCAAFYNAFHYTPESNLTWHMREVVRERVFYHTFTHTETPEELDALRRQLAALLQPGDVIVYSRPTWGHALLYLDERTFLHCTQHGAKGSYDYAARHDIVSEHGGIYADDSRWLLSPCTEPGGYGGCYLFHPDNRVLAVLRPLDRVGEPTPDALARVGDARGLRCAVTVSHPGAHAAAPGDTVRYTLQVRNARDTAVTAKLSFTAPAGCEAVGQQPEALTVPAGGTAEADFCVRVTEDAQALQPPQLAGPAIRVNGLTVWAPRVLIGQRLAPAEAAAQVAQGVRAALAAGLGMPEALERAYAAVGLPFPSDLTRRANDLFYRVDAASADVLYRLPQRPAADLGVYSYFGGIGVITPETVTDPDLRVQELRMADLQPGDVLVCCDDAMLTSPYACLYTGDGFLGQPEADAAPQTLTGADALRWLDSLPGRFVWFALRPAQGA